MERSALKTREELLAEIERLHRFIMLMAERIAGASEVLSIVAERKTKNINLDIGH